MSIYSHNGGFERAHPGMGIDTRNIKVVKSIGLATAEAKQKPSPWTKSMFKLWLCFGVAFIFSTTNGFTPARWVVKNFDTYNEYFGTPTHEQNRLKVVLDQIGWVWGTTGALSAIPLIHFKGRKGGIFVGALGTSICWIITAATQGWTYLLIMDTISNFFSSILNIAIWTYVTELAHPSYRGPMVGSVNCFYLLGEIPGIFIPRATSDMSGEWSWRIVFVLIAVGPTVIAATCLFLPESPRWLMANHRETEALAVMAKYYGDGDPNAAIVQLTLDEMRADISSTKQWWDLRVLFNTREARYRFILCYAMGVLGQWAGNAVVTKYYPQMLAGVGADDLKSSLLLKGMQSPILIVGALCGALFTDRIGRRRQLLIGCIAFAVIFTIVTPLSAASLIKSSDGTLHSRSPAHVKAFIAVLFFFSLAFSFCLTPLQVMYQIEVLQFNARAPGYAMSSILRKPFYVYDDYVTPVAFTNLGWRYYIWFIVWNLLAAGMVYFFFVETAGRTLEELTQIFKSQYPVKTSLSRSKVVVEGDEIIVHNNIGKMEAYT